MSEIEWIPTSWVIPLVLVKGLLAFTALILILINMLSVWRFPELVVSPSRRSQLYSVFAAALLICWGSSEQMTRLTDIHKSFTLGYQHLFSIFVCTLFIYSQVRTWHENHHRRRLVT